MSVNLKTLEIGNAAVALVSAAAASWAWTPILLMVGDIAYYPRNTTESNDLPAVFIRPVRVDLTHRTVTMREQDSTTFLRVVVADKWASGDVVMTKKIERAQDVAQAFVGAANYPWNLNATISGLEILHAVPTAIEYEPPEAAFINVEQEYVVAVSVAVTAVSTR